MLTESDVRNTIVTQIKYEPKNIERLCRLYSLIHEKPLRKISFYAYQMKMSEAGIYPMLKTLRNAGLLDKKATKVITDSFNWHTYLPPVVKDRTILPTCKYQSLAYHLRKYDDQQMVPGFGKTKEELISAVAEKLLPDTTTIILAMAELLAQLAFLKHDISMYKSSPVGFEGSTDIDPNNYKELL